MPNFNRHLSFIDQVLVQADQMLRTICVVKRPSTRVNPAHDVAMSTLNTQEMTHSARLMRVNHTGEVCAQALYQGQAITAHNLAVKNQLARAAQEEIDHLAWCEERLQELNDHPSYLNFFWYGGSLMLGIIAGLISDQTSLGFLQETEEQVTAHLEKHLQRLPENDLKSRAIVEQMRNEEAQHATTALQAGAKELPYVIKSLMRLMSKVMTGTAYWV